MQRDKVIAVNEQDEQIGILGKLEAHQKGILHRAFSVFVLNEKNELLLQQRAAGKYHSPNLWSNTCCSHPMPGEDTAEAAHRRLKEEMGFDCPLRYMFHFTYSADVGNGLTENELDHVYIGNYNGSINTNPEEVQDHRFIAVEELLQLATEQPGSFTTWLRLVLPKFAEHLKALKTT